MEKLLKLADKISQDNNNLIKGAGILFVCRDDGTLLLMLRSDKVKQSNTWGIPGGHVETGESFQDAATRETKEEVGSFPAKMIPIDTLTNKWKNYLYQIFVVGISLFDKINWMKDIKLNQEHIKYEWFKFGEIPQNLHSAIDIIKL